MKIFHSLLLVVVTSDRAVQSHVNTIAAQVSDTYVSRKLRISSNNFITKINGHKFLSLLAIPLVLANFSSG